MIEITNFNFSDADVAGLIEHLNNWDIVQWLSHVPFPYSEAHAKDWFLKFDEDYRAFAIRDGGVLIGCVSCDFDGEIGYWLAESHWGRGIMTDAVSMAVAFTPRPAYYATVLVENKGSRRVIEKNGFTTDGAVFQMKSHRNAGKDALKYVRINADYGSSQPT